jgi:hypothetical protein
VKTMYRKHPLLHTLVTLKHSQKVSVNSDASLSFGVGTNLGSRANYVKI